MLYRKYSPVIVTVANCLSSEKTNKPKQTLFQQALAVVMLDFF